VDNQIVTFQKPAGEDKWVYSRSCRPHTHDVLALAVAETPKGEILVSGGIDTQLCWSNVQSQPGITSKLAPFPHRPILHLAAVPRLLLSQYPHRLDIWQLASDSSFSTESVDAVDKRIQISDMKKMMFQLKLKGPQKLVCSAISPDGTWVSCSNSVQSKLFRLNAADGRVEQIQLPSEIAGVSHCLAFTPDSSMLVLALQSSVVKVLHLSSLEVVSVFHHHNVHVQGHNHEMDETAHLTENVCTLAISADGQWLASGDQRNTIHVFNLDTGKHYFSVPALDSMHTTFQFHNSSSSLVVACVSNRFYIFDMEERKLSDWSVEFGDRLPSELLQQPGKIIGIAFDPVNVNTITLYSHNYLCKIDLDKPMPDEAAKKSKSRKRDRSNPDAAAAQNFEFVSKYKPVLFMDFISDKEMLVVEAPWLKIMQKFPDMLYRPKYGS